MEMNKVDVIVQYALVVAAENDEYSDRQLGPIHLLKYVYLADLAYSEIKHGKTFTGTRWIFHDFGPWSAEAFERIEPALHQVGAIRKRSEDHRFEGDFIRWSLSDEDTIREISKVLPFHISDAVKRAVRAYGSDTASLLHHVYCTRPMLKAAPGEPLDFSVLDEGHQDSGSPQIDETKEVKASRKHREQLTQEFLQFKDRIQSKLKQKVRQKRLVTPDPLPRYDEVFFEGLEWLDNLAGEKIEPVKEKVIFSDEVWKSPARYDPDVS